MKNILIIGATSAIASACARQWATDNAKIYLVARNTEKLSQVSDDLGARGATLHNYVLDLNDIEQHNKMLDDCFSTMGTVDVVLIAHGTLPDQGECEVDVSVALEEFRTNGLNVMALLTEIANRMQSQGSGTIAVISSVAGDRGRKSNYLYGAAKGALSIFCSGLRARLLDKGVHVLTIKPGFVDTPMTKELPLPQMLVVSPEKVASDILRAIDKKKDTLYTPWFWRFIMLIIIHLPNFIFKRLNF